MFLLKSILLTVLLVTAFAEDAESQPGILGTVESIANSVELTTAAFATIETYQARKSLILTVVLDQLKID
jgi:hypothetical protein